MRLPSNAYSGYRIVVSRAPQRPHAQVFLFGVRDPIPDVPVPLHANEPEPSLPLNQIMHELYDSSTSSTIALATTWRSTTAAQPNRRSRPQTPRGWKPASRRVPLFH
jgi:hypothetical protein